MAFLGERRIEFRALRTLKGAKLRFCMASVSLACIETRGLTAVYSGLPSPLPSLERFCRPSAAGANPTCARCRISALSEANCGGGDGKRHESNSYRSRTSAAEAMITACLRGAAKQ